MRYQNWWWILAIWYAFLVEIGSAGPYSLAINQRFPDKGEIETCGRIRDVIQRDSGRFRRILIRNTNNNVEYIDEDARRMTSRTKSKLDVLASLAISQWGNANVRVTRAWTDQVDASDPTSLHYEGRSVRLQTRDGDTSKLGRLAGLAIEAGFDWVEYTNTNYIRASVIPDVCQTSVDLVFVLDNSGSVGGENFNKVKDFVKRVIDFFNIGTDGTHVSVVTYDTNTQIEFNLVRYFTKNELRSAVDDIRYRGFLTYTGEALNTVRQSVLTTSAGMRSDDGIPKVLLLLTDGYSNGIKPLQPANQLRDLGVSIFSIGVGPSVSQAELNEIASDPDRDYVFTLSSFNQLASFVDRVSSVSCSEGSLINSCKGAETTVESGSFKYFRTTFDVITKDEVSIEVRDSIGISHLYASGTSKNPGPLDADSVKNEEDSSPKAVSVKIDETTKTVYVAVQGQQETNKFILSFWDNLFVNRGTFQVDVEEGLDPHDIITLNMVQHSYNLKFTITDGDTSLFSIRVINSIPKIATRLPLDYEASPKYSVVVIAEDMANKCHKSRALVEINVIDKNDNRPTFEKNAYTASIFENAQRNTLVIQVVATDSDSGKNGEISYSITASTAPGLFRIDATTGEVTLQGPLNYENETSYTLTLKAEDMGSPSLNSTVQLTISVLDVNEQPSISCDGGDCIYTVSEAASSGTSIGKLSTDDPDTAANCLLQYSFSKPASDKFTVSSNGDITTIASLDREIYPQYVFYVTVRDCGTPSLTDSIRITITVGDVNDNDPRFPGPYVVEMNENESLGSRVVQVKATDADEGKNAELKYTIRGNDASHFSINADDGTITTASTLDYEKIKSYTFNVLAHDQGPGDRHGETTVTVNVLDLNDNAPSFVGTPYIATVKENAGQGTHVINVNATDSDSGAGGQVKYSIISGNTRLGFAIHEDTGLITVNSDLDKETTPFYTLLVQAKDSGSPSQNSQTTVSITVRDTNDNKPIFQGLPYTASVPEDFGTIQPVLTVSATDDDTGIFGVITYRIDSPPIANETFTIDNDGNIRVKTSLDYETKKDYTFTVVAKDGGNQETSASVTIYVTDVNDHAPRFDKNPYTESLLENLNSDHVVGTVRATDDDSGQRGSVTYSIIGGNIGDSFTINANGEVIAVIRLDRETREFYNLTVEAKDGGSPAKSSTTQVEITVLDVNDNTPLFDNTFYSFRISENNAPGAEVGQFGPATDGDKGPNGEIVYTILSGDPNGDFEYDGTTGKLKASKVLDRESISMYSLGFEARDKGTPSRSSTVVVQVIVDDRNDNSPIFSENPYNCEIDENSAINSRVCFVFASDSDFGQNGAVTYRLVTSSTTFSVDQDNGEIKALVTLDRESTPSYSFDIIANDKGSPSESSTVTVNVKVLDKNDNEPEFDKPSYSFDVSEGAAVNTLVGEVRATDKDEDKNGEVVYSITSGNRGTAFLINATGFIKVNSGLDRESISSYRLTVRAADRGTPSRVSSRNVIITVTDINDNDPMFTADLYPGKISEDASVGSPVVQVKATDADEGVNSQIKYSITSGENHEHFNIDEDSGFINTATKLDYESKKSYLLTVTASDGGNPKRTDTAKVNITVENTNDNAPTFKPTSPIVYVSEAVAIGTNVVQFNATDEDGNSLTFLITSGNTDNTFSIDKNTGLLTTNASLDRETVPSYNLTVTVTDEGQSSSRDLTVIVIDVNDNEPRFDPPSYSVNITENSSAGPVVTVTATDNDEGDNAKITYSIDSSSKTNFTIDATTGEISTEAPLDYEESPRFVITVTATDSGTPPLSSTATVIITVKDLNDNNPHFSRDYSTSLRENTAEGTVIRVEATDPDSGINGEIEYRITSGNDGGFFKIGRSDGIIEVASPPDREQNPSFTLIVTASNKVPASSAPSTKSTATVVITIDDVNDNKPVITNTETSVAIPENSAKDTPVLDVDATDRDIGSNSELEYHIVDGNINDVFAINTVSGLITVDGSIDHEIRQSYTLNVRVSDKGNPSLFSERPFLVNVTDLDDNIPEFSATSYEGSVSEAANISTFVIQVTASDKDSGVNGKLKFSIVSGNVQNHFKIDRDTGDIRTNALLDFETIPTYTVRVRVEDATHSVETNVSIRLININDNNPIFNPAQYRESIAEDRSQGDAFLTITATDLDAFGGLTYTILSGNTNSRFTLEPGSGKLRVAGELDRETTDFYNLIVQVTDGGAPARSDTAFVKIQITDINDNPPRFNTSREQVSVRENSPVGTPVLSVFADDKDIDLNGEVTYNITYGNNDGLFTLGETSGILTVNGNIDRETITSFRLGIEAQDKGTPSLKSSTLVVDIEVLDANDNSPQFTKPSYSRSISESSSVASFVEEVRALDADIGANAEVVYSLLNGTEYFKIDNKTGVISTIVALDREAVSSYTVLVFAKDLGTPSQNSTTFLRVTVLDANDNAPVFDNNTLYANVTEEQPRGLFVTRVIANDADEGMNAQIEYKLESNGKQFLEINSTTGVVTTLELFDFEAQRNHTFKVTATDKGNPSLSTTEVLYINVLDTDDNCPVFNPKEYNVTIEENRPFDLTIVTVYATDIDTVGDQRLEYGIREGDVHNSFEIGRYTGVITPRDLIDREAASEVNLVVRAGNELCGVNFTGDTDELIEKRLSKSIARVNVFVTDLNDNAPKFVKESYKHQLRDIYATHVLLLNATDPDVGASAEFDFGLHGVTRDGGKRTLTVTATDKGVPQMTSNTTVEVTADNCETMKFSVSPRGNVSVKTLCSFERALMTGKDLVGEKITLDCYAIGNTVPEYRWIKDGVPATSWQNTGVYVIKSLRKDNAGDYSCIASSEAGNIVSPSIRIFANEAAKITVPPKEIYAQIGQAATLSCRASGDQPITYRWYKDGLRQETNNEINYNQPDLVFKEILSTDTAGYSCEVENKYGSQKSEPATLHVYDVSSVVEMDINVNNPRTKENCQLFNITTVTETLNGLLEGKVTVVEFDKPKEMCNITACSSDPCRNQGECIVRGSGFVCQCPRGWGGLYCEQDSNECETSKETCQNNGTCVNRQGSFSCACPPNSNINGKLCQFKENICENKCPAAEKCYPKENQLGYECITNPRTVSMEYQLDSSQRPFEDWMKYDIAQIIENAIVTSGLNERSQGDQGGRKRRDTVTGVDYGACSVRITDYKDKGETLDMTVVLVCKKSPSKTFVCNAMFNQGMVQSCTGNDGILKTKEQTKQAPQPESIDLTVVFIARNANDEDVNAAQTVDILNSQNILEKLRKDGMTVTDIRTRTPTTAKQESDNLSAGVVAGIVIAVLLLLMVAAMILFVFMRTRRNKDRDFSIGVRAILTTHSKKKKRSPRHDISMKEINDTEMRGIGNKMFSDLEDERRDSDANDSSFMVNIPKSISKTHLIEPDYTSEFESAEWFHGSISRSKAENILEIKEEDGSYLVRAGIDKGEFYVTARISDSGPKYRHIAVNRHDDCFVAVCGPESQAMKFTTFHELLEYLRSTPTRFEDTDSELLLKDYVGKDGD